MLSVCVKNSRGIYGFDISSGIQQILSNIVQSKIDHKKEMSYGCGTKLRNTARQNIDDFGIPSNTNLTEITIRTDILIANERKFFFIKCCKIF